MNVLHQSILNTLAFFAAQEQTCTLLELHVALFRVSEEQVPVSLTQLQQELDELSGKYVTLQNGIYTLADFAHLFALRHNRYINSLKLYKKSRRFVSYLRHVPFVRAAALSGSVVAGSATEESDIDLFIIVAPTRMYLARALVSAYFQLFGGRRHGGKIRKRFCLNHYVTEGVVLEHDHNFYTAVEYINLLAVFGQKIIKEFFDSNKSWISRFVLQPDFSMSVYFPYALAAPSRFQKILETLLWPLAGML